MKYFVNYEADAVLREDENGKRYVKRIENLKEIVVDKDSSVAWGVPSYGVFNKLEPITEEEYKEFGKIWYWCPRTGVRRMLINRIDRMQDILSFVIF